MARDYNLVPAFLGEGEGEGEGEERAARRTATEEEKELRPMLRPLYQFMSCKELDDLFENMHKMRRAKIREPHAAGAMASPRWGSRPSTRRPATSARRTRRRRWPGRAGMASSRRSSSCRTEKVLCGSLNLSPMRYVIVKTILIKDHLQKRQRTPSKSCLPSYLDKVLKKRILNFLTESGWTSRYAS